MSFKSQTKPWYDRLPTLQEGYYYPWHSRLGIWNGESEFLSLVHQHLQPETDLFEAACGHGEMAFDLALHCRSVLAYDRMAAWIELAQQTAQEKGNTNIIFVCHDSSPEANDGQVRLPAPDNSFDVLICSKGPFHWIKDAVRVARPNAVLLMLVPDAIPIPPWYQQLPQVLRWEVPSDPNWARTAIEQRLGVVGLTIHSWWSFEVPEVFLDPEQMYRWLSWGRIPNEVPSLLEVHLILEQIFIEHSNSEGVAVQRRRYIWKSVVPG